MLSSISAYLSLNVLKSIAIWLLIFALYIAILIILRRVYQFVYLLQRSTVCLELTPLAWSDKTPEATSQLFLSLHSLNDSRHLLDKIFGRQVIISLEITSSRTKGIRYIIQCDSIREPVIKHMIASYMPDVKVNKIKDDMSGIDTKNSKVYEYRQTKHFAYPLKDHVSLDSHDPISYITNAMTKLNDGEYITFQVLAKPVNIKSARSLNNKIMTNDDLQTSLGNSHAAMLFKITSFINNLLFGIVDLFTTSYHSSSQNSYRSDQKELEYRDQVARRLKPARTLSFFEQELVESIHHKLEQPLFRVDIRLLVYVTNKQKLMVRKMNMESALNVYSVEKNQKLRLRKAKFHTLSAYSRFLFMRRMPSFFKSHSNVFSASEIASLYHFPNSNSAKTENVVKSLSKSLPAPISLKGRDELDVLIGENIHQGVSTPIGLTASDRERHMYVIGGTGNGKTTMLLYAIIQDIQNGKGVAVLDPHGDLAETILRHIPGDRIADVIYLNPDDLSHPIGINLLELPPNLKGDELLREKDLITESTISVLRKIFSEDDSGGHRIEYVLRNTIQTALTMESATLFTIFRLLNDNKFRREVVKKLDDQDLKNFWDNELGKAGDFQKVKMVAGITAKIGRFLFSASAKRILEQEKSTIDFNDILDSGKILICNFSKGLLGEDTSALFGTSILAKLQVASLRRARLQQANRRPYYLYVDEFQNFATMSFVQMLSEARKYKLFLTMAEQSTSQQDQQRLVDIILANVGTVICFRSGSPADERYVLPLFSPYIEQGEIANLPSYNFYIRISVVHSQEPLSGMTVLLNNEGSVEVANRVVEYSRKTYGKKINEATPDDHRNENMNIKVKPTIIRSLNNNEAPVEVSIN